MITDKQLQDLGLVPYENGYYQINDEITVDVEGNIRVDNEYTTKPIWIGQVISIDELHAIIPFLLR